MSQYVLVYAISVAILRSGPCAPTIPGITAHAVRGGKSHAVVMDILHADTEHHDAVSLEALIHHSLRRWVVVASRFPCPRAPSLTPRPWCVRVHVVKCRGFFRWGIEKEKVSCIVADGASVMLKLCDTLYVTVNVSWGMLVPGLWVHVGVEAVGLCLPNYHQDGAS